jgi:uncharacterized membrane protein YccC
MAAEVGHRRILRLVVALDRSQLQVARGVRNAAGIVALLAVGILSGDVVAGIAMAGGALLVGFCDLGASYASRAKVMLLGSVLAGIAAGVGTLTGGIDWLTVLLMALAGFGAGFAVSLGMAPAFVGLSATLSMLLAAYYPAGLGEALERAGLTVVGGLVQTALALSLWPLRPFRPERAAVANAYRAVATFVDAMATGASTDKATPPLFAGLGQARVLLDDAEGRQLSSTPAGEAFRTLVLEADRAYPEVIALAHVRSSLPPPAAAATLDALDATATALRAIAGELDGGAPCDAEVEQLRARLRAATTTIGSEGDGAGPQTAARLEALRAQLRAAADAATGWTRGREFGSRLRHGLRRRRALGAHASLSILHANFSLQSPAFRHGVRLGATLAVATALYRVLDLPRGYWVPLTVAFVLKPDFGSTFSRGLQRYAGTIVGAVLATAITALLNPGHWTLVVLVGIFAVGIYTFLFANYLLFTTSVTALIVFFVAFDGVAEWTAVTDRVLDTLIGGALTLAAYAVWPTWEGERVSGRLADLVDAQRIYVQAVLEACIDPTRYDGDALHEARLAGRRARTAAEASVAQAQAEPTKHRGDIDADLDILASLRRFADGALALESVLEDDANRAPRRALRRLADDMDKAMAELAACLRDGGRAPRLPPLRADHDALERSERADSPVAQETDRLVNALDTLGHLLTPPAPAPSAPAAPAVGAPS